MGSAPPAKRAKYGNCKVEVDGITFDSRREAARYQTLKAMQAAGQIRDLRRQVPFVLTEAVVLDGRKKPALRYVADFTYVEGGALVVEDVKSTITAKASTYRTKKHLMKAVHGIDIREVR
ncbi:DUF1064 domain-containing protein [Chitinasiproducens palmae]|uniref:DUF1064 domain-containing protein n=1 Tax=Chitinasiproducens palmae TaxID=1770053 RepID=UPI001F170AFC|nr:DUF1064 domain-containing protein [Chitinasiproducens palmae]